LIAEKGSAPGVDVRSALDVNRGRIATAVLD
jgi:hypothetical protein